MSNLFGTFLSDSAEELKGKGGARNFGLNQGFIISKYEFNPNASADGSPNPALDINLTSKDGSTIYYTIYGNPTIFDANGNILEDTSSEEYQKKFRAEVATLQGVLTHFAKLVYTEEEYKKLLTDTNPTSAAELLQFSAKVMSKAVIEKTPIEVFLQYQWSIKKDNDRTFLELPKNLKDGYFLSKATKGPWKEVRDEEGLRYLDNEGNEHIFKRSANYLTTNKAIEQVKGGASANAVAAAAMNSNGNSGIDW